MPEPHWIDVTSITDAGYRIEMDAMSSPPRYRHCRMSGSGQSEWLPGRPPEPAAPMTKAELALRDGTANDVAHELLAERKRQIAEEGWTPKHDERHEPGDLIRAAIAYAVSAASYDMRATDGYLAGVAVQMWPFVDGFKPKDMRRDLVRAGALLIASIERLDRDQVRDADNLADG